MVGTERRGAGYVSARRKRVWLHPDSGLEGWDGCLRLVVTVLVGLAGVAVLLCLLGALGGSAWKFVTCVTGGDC